VSDDESLSPWVDVRGYAHLVFYCTSADTTSGGVVSFEEAAPNANIQPNSPTPWSATTGAYSIIMTATASDFTGGAQKAYHAPVGAYAFVRARVSTAITGGGKVSVGLVAY
jgi:hypothetical protein